MDEMNRARGGGKILHLGNLPPCDNVTPAMPLSDETEVDGKQALDELICIMREGEMDPVIQLAGYFVTEDPTYLPTEHHARGLAHRVGRDKLLRVLIEQYVHNRTNPENREGD